MDLGWIVALGSGHRAEAQMSIAREGGGGTPVPAVSIEMDEVDGHHARARATGAEIVYGPVDEPWGVRRFFRDRTGMPVNVLSQRAGIGAASA